MPDKELPNNQDVVTSATPSVTPAQPIVGPAIVDGGQKPAVEKTKMVLSWKVLVGALVVLLCGTLGGLAYAISQLQNSRAEIRNLKAEIDTMGGLFEEEVGDKSGVDNSEQVEEENTPISTERPASGIKTQMYLEPKGWDVKFAYPDGVTSIEYSMVDENYDGAVYINRIVKNGKTYDVDMCSGREEYKHYPFFLGFVYRWNPTAQHESWVTSPDEYGEDLLRKVGVNEYYVNFDDSGNGCGAKGYSDYLEALEIVRELYRGIEVK